MTEINKDPCTGSSGYFVAPKLPVKPVNGFSGIDDKDYLASLDGFESDVAVTFQGKTDAVVVLQKVQVRVSERKKPNGVAVSTNGGCGGVTPRNFSIDLDRPNPRASAVPGDDLGMPVPAVDFPFRISKSEPEVLHFFGTTRECDCSWRIEISWTGEGKSGTEIIDNHGRPFRTVGIKHLPLYQSVSSQEDSSTFEWADAGFRNPDYP
ncbi:hypothetical protein [Streptosporangium sp. CA-115845]|uniref:hypothetical protein n=1 Tax=Streptosporangium sp. CA-115845 TaxID=3240071 RepID=UPI003D8D3AB1